MGRILAIDYGRKRVGLAVSDTLQISANGLQTVEEKNALDVIINYVIKNDVEEIIIGYPTHVDGNDLHSTPYIRTFISALEKKLPGLPILKRDEAYSSKMAMQALIAGGVKKKERRKKENIDKMSAVLILQEYLQNK